MNQRGSQKNSTIRNITALAVFLVCLLTSYLIYSQHVIASGLIGSAGLAIVIALFAPSESGAR
jgi:hypothetical protein